MNLTFELVISGSRRDESTDSSSLLLLVLLPPESHARHRRDFEIAGTFTALNAEEGLRSHAEEAGVDATGKIQRKYESIQSSFSGSLQTFHINIKMLFYP